MRIIVTLIIIIVAIGIIYVYRSDLNIDSNLISGISQIRKQFSDDSGVSTTKIYKYRNAKGEWVYSNKPPEKSGVEQESVLEYRNDTNVLPAPSSKSGDTGQSTTKHK